MFKTAATKLAHNTTLPSLGVSEDLRPLQDLITAEKSVLTSLQKLSADFSKSAEALRAWGLGEGDDLGDILSASATILLHFSAALSQYAQHGHEIREQLKSIRTREENLEDLRRRRRNVMGKADSADRKLNKMSSEHKNFLAQADNLNRLRDEIRTLDSEIMVEEASLGDYKRSSTRVWMGLKFGGLLECCEKGIIAAEFGKLVITEIPEETTQPGHARSLYHGSSTTESLVSQAYRCINDVTLSALPSARDTRRQSQRLPSFSQEIFASLTGGSVPQSNYHQVNSTNSDSSAVFLPVPHGFGTGQFLDNVESPSTKLNDTPSSASPTMRNTNIDEPTAPPPGYFRTSSPRQSHDDSSSSAAVRLANFPVNRLEGKPTVYTLRDDPRDPWEDSVLTPMAEALSGSSDSGARDRHDLPRSSTDDESRASDSPLYEPQPLGSAGSAPQASRTPDLAMSSVIESNEERPVSQWSADDGDAVLAYVADDDDKRAYHSAMGGETPAKHVTFGQASHTDLERREKWSSLPSPYENTDYDAHIDATPNQSDLNLAMLRPGDYYAPQSTGRPSPKRVPPPSDGAERALDAAAAQEIVRELRQAPFERPTTANFVDPVSVQKKEHGRAHDLRTVSIDNNSGPPRFQAPTNQSKYEASHPSPVPSQFQLAASSSISDSWFPSGTSETPYITPPEYPAYNKPSTPINPPPSAAAMRTIPAAAFKRPRYPSNTDGLEPPPSLTVRKPLPTSPLSSSNEPATVGIDDAQ